MSKKYHPKESEIKGEIAICFLEFSAKIANILSKNNIKQGLLIPNLGDVINDFQMKPLEEGFIVPVDNTFTDEGFIDFLWKKLESFGFIPLGAYTEDNIIGIEIYGYKRDFEIEKNSLYNEDKKKFREFLEKISKQDIDDKMLKWKL